MLSRKLTPGEITNVIEKIRKRYDEYIYKFFKPKTLRDAFENRYRKALDSRVDISSFLLAEISAIDELIKREEERVATHEPTVVEEQPHQDIADKVLEENRRRIQGYPDLNFHNDANPEIRRLAGALNALAGDRWQQLSNSLRATAYSMTSTEMLALDSRLRSLSSVERDEMPPRLVRYVAQLRKFPRSFIQIDREEKEYILETAFFLHDLLGVLDRVKRLYGNLGGEERRELDNTIQYVSSIIADFRLKDLKRKTEWQREQ